MKKTILHIQLSEENKYPNISVRTRILSALRALLCEGIHRVDKALASDRRSVSLRTRNSRQDNRQKTILSKNGQAGVQDNIDSGKSGKNFQGLSVRDYCRIGLTEL